MAPANVVPTLAPGQSVGRYRIIELLGAGGMGEVYRANDPSLGRDVALKVVAAPRSADGRWVRLFEQEARGVAALNHPNVVAIYDAIAAGSRACIVFELLDGVSLRQRLQQRDITPRKAVSYAIQIAEGLTAIHAKGMVHRDLKPENVFVTRSGVVKILDFGIAKVLEDEVIDAADVTADTVDLKTAPGQLRGTVGYMSPEQLKGEGVDSRSDVFSFGLVLYEMLAQRRAFEGSPASVIAAILTQEPPALTSPAVPHGLRRIVQRCLEKRADDRFHSAHDLGLALRVLVPEMEGARPRPSRRVMIALASGALAMLAALILSATTRPTPGPSRALRIEPETLPLTSTPGLEFQPALSRDGSRVAYVWNGADGGENFDIYTKSVDVPTTFRLTTDPAPECCPVWSPDGRSIAFVRTHAASAQIVIAPAMGGAERVVRAIHPWFGTGLSWSPDGKTLAFSDRDEEGGAFRVFLLSADDGQAQPLSAPDGSAAGDGFPAFSPDGMRLAYVRQPARDQFQWSDILVRDIDSGTETLVLRENSLVAGLDWTPDGREIVYSASAPGGAARLWRLDLDGRSRRPVGDGMPLSNVTGAEALASVSRALRVSVAAGAHRLAFARGAYDTNIWAVARAGEPSTPRMLIASTRLDEAPQYSPDGRRIAFASDRSTPLSQIWVCFSDGTSCQQMTSFTTSCGSPRWSPDGRRIAFDAAPESQTDVYVVDVDARKVTRATSSPSHEAVPSWARDGRSLYVASDRTGEWQVWRIALDGGADGQVTRFGGYMAVEGEDGRTLFYTKESVPGIFSRTPDGRETRVAPLPQCKGYWALAAEGLYAIDSNAPQGPVLQLLRRPSYALEVVARLPGEVACGETGLAASPDGKHLAYVAVSRGSDLMLIDHFR
jgi:Tol biopolymer transport system component